MTHAEWSGCRSAGWLALMMAFLFLGAPDRADACSFPCKGIVEVPLRSQGGEVRFAANAVAFRLAPKATPERAASFRLAIYAVDSQARVPGSVSTSPTGTIDGAGTETLFKPDAPLEVGKRYVLKFDPSCPPNAPNMTAPIQELPFVVDEAATLPLKFDALRPTAEGLRYNDRGEPRAFAELPFGTSNSLLLQSIIEFSVEVDGYYIQAPYLGRSHRLTIEATCGVSSFREDTATSCGGYLIPPGPHVVKVTPRVLGISPQPPPLVANIELRGCPPAPDPAAGCAISPRGQIGGAGVVAVLLVLAGLSRQRRRRPSTGD